MKLASLRTLIDMLYVDATNAAPLGSSKFKTMVSCNCKLSSLCVVVEE
jgi:hypothetical protein